MDGNDRHHRAQDHPAYAAQRGFISTAAQYPPASAAERYRQASVASSPASASTLGRGGAAQGFTYGYGDANQYVGAQVQQSALQYPAEYAQDATRQSGHQYPQYGAGPMYNIPPQAQAPSGMGYEAVQQYQARHSGSVDVLPTQFGVAQPYMMASEGVPSGAAATHMSTQVTSQYPSQQAYIQQSPVRQDSSASAYTTPAMSDPAQSASRAGYGQQEFSSQTTQTSASDQDQDWANYQAALRETFSCIRDGRLREAANNVLQLSAFLVGRAESYGLVRDETNLHAERLELWRRFNYAWLATLQKQKEMTLEMVRTGRQPPHPQSTIELEFLTRMGDDLVKHSDSMERHGLVDYEMGIWEEDIMDILIECVDILKRPRGKDFVAAGTAAGRQR